MGHVWDPARFTLGTLGYTPVNVRRPRNGRPYAFLLLNQPLEDTELAISLFRQAHYTIFADGGANHFHELMQKGDARFDIGPDFICGDLDSIRPDVEKYYQRKHVTFLKDDDQYSTDFMKCLKRVGEDAKDVLFEYDSHSPGQNAAALDIVVLGGLGGRADQAFSQLHHLYVASEEVALTLGDIYLVTSKSIIFVLQKGVNIIQTPVGPDLLTENVGIIPIGRPSVITTTGLEWDVEDWPTEFGTQISTSNHTKARVVRVKTTERVLFTVELAEQKKEEKTKPGTVLDKKENRKRPRSDSTP